MVSTNTKVKEGIWKSWNLKPFLFFLLNFLQYIHHDVALVFAGTLSAFTVDYTIHLVAAIISTAVFIKVMAEV